MVDNKFPRMLIVEDSSQIRGVSYNPETRDMFIQFVNERFYQYWDVEPQIFGALASAESVGGMFNKIKKNLKAYQEIEL